MCIYIYKKQNWSGVIVKWGDSKTLGVLLNNKNKVAQWFSRKSSLVWHIKPQKNTFEPWPNPFSAEFTEISLSESLHNITMCVYGNSSTTPLG